MPGGNGIIADPFVGAVGLSLAIFGICVAVRSWQVRLFCALGLAGLFGAMAADNVVYGVLYSILPFIEKAREPVEALALFHFSLAALIAIGANAQLSSSPLSPALIRLVVRLLLWFGAITIGCFYLRIFVNLPGSFVESDSRILVIALVGLLAATLYSAAQRGIVTKNQLFGVLLLLLVTEQGNEVGHFEFISKSDLQHAIYLKPMAETEDIGEFLRHRPSPKRIEWNEKDFRFCFGDWNRIDGIQGSGASLPMNLQLLEPWSDRVSHLFGVGYSVSRTSMRPGQREVFHNSAGYKVFENPEAFPRAWTVHQVQHAATEDDARKITARGDVDLRTTAVLTSSLPPLAVCQDDDRMQAIDERPMQTSVTVQMKCRGMLVVSDNWFPGWRATVDGNSTPILRVDSAIRGIPLEGGEHRVELAYRPWPIYTGLVLALVGLSGAAVLQIRPEPDGVDAISAEA